MPITVEWYNDAKTILLERFEGDWTLDEYKRLIDEARLMLSTVDHTVHILVDGRLKSPRLPANLISGGMLYAARHLPPNQGITVFVGVDAVSAIFVNIARNIGPRLHRTLFTTDTVEDALRIIEQQASKTE